MCIYIYRSLRWFDSWSSLQPAILVYWSAVTVGQDMVKIKIIDVFHQQITMWISQVAKWCPQGLFTMMVSIEINMWTRDGKMKHENNTYPSNIIKLLWPTPHHITGRFQDAFPSLLPFFSNAWFNRWLLSCYHLDFFLEFSSPCHMMQFPQSGEQL